MREGFREIDTNAVVLACGGFESNTEMRTRYLGPGWELAKVRRTQFNTGDGIQMALNIGAQSYGHWSGCHAVAWDMNAPAFGDRNIADLFQQHSYPFSLIVNVEGKRFVDEGADLRNYTYAKYGKEILAQPQRVAFQLFDQKTKHLLRDEYFIPQASVVEADTIEELADGLGIDVATMTQTIAEVQRCCAAGRVQSDCAGRQAHGRDRAAKVELGALRWTSRPYMGYAVTCGLTFTFRWAEDKCAGAGDRYGGGADPGVVRGGRADGRAVL